MPSLSRGGFLERYDYEVETDLSVDGVPATWAATKDKPAHRYWGDEDYKIAVDFAGDERGEGGVSALSPDNQLVAVSGGNLITIYHVMSKQQRSQFRGPTQDCRRLLFVPSTPTKGYQLISESSDVSGLDGSIVFWKLDDQGGVVETGNASSLQTSDLAAQSVEAIGSTLSETHGLARTSSIMEQVLNDYTRALDKLKSQLIMRDLQTLNGHIASFGADPFSPDGKTLLYLKHNKTTQHGSRPAADLPHIVLHDLETNTQKHALGGHDDAIMWVGFSPDGKTIASASWDSTLRLWDVATGKLAHLIGSIGGQCWSGAWSPDSNHVLFSGMSQPDTHVAVYSRSTGEEVVRFKHERLKHWARYFAWSTDNNIAIANGLDVWIWRPFEDVIISTFTLKAEERLMQNFASVHGLQWDEGGKFLILRTGDGTVEVWDSKENVKWRLQRPKGTPKPRRSSGLSWVTIQKLLIRLDGDGYLRFYNL